MDGYVILPGWSLWCLRTISDTTSAAGSRALQQQLERGRSGPSRWARLVCCGGLRGPAHGPPSGRVCWGSWTRTSASPACAATTTSVTLASPVPLCFDHRDVGRVDEDVAVAVVALELHQVHRLPPTRRARPCAFSLPDCLHRGHRDIMVQTESDQTGFPGSLVAYALS